MDSLGGGSGALKKDPGLNGNRGRNTKRGERESGGEEGGSII